MSDRWTKNVLLAFVLACITARGAEPSPEQLDFFEKRIRPLLTDRCYECHSATSKKVKGGLVLDTREGLLKGGDSGPALKPGKPDESLLIKAVRYQDEDLKMPPKTQLHPDATRDLEKWVAMGAPDPRTGSSPSEKRLSLDFEKAKDFWSFKPVTLSALPKVQKKGWAKSEIDFFVQAKLEEKKLQPAVPADKRTLMRRATFDLTGLPPTPEEIHAFLQDKSPKAFEKVIDRLLASSRYGERWGRHWLDLVRYADTAGDSSDYPVPQAYKYRNYVIQAFNEDRPYDQFIREQVAGDLMPSSGNDRKFDRIVATGYLAMARRFGVNPEGDQHLTIEDTIDNLGRTFLGLSISCARCHDHKYDPIPTQDYYALYGIFNSTRYPFAGSENEKKQRNLIPLVPQAELDALVKPFEAKLKPIDEEIRVLERERSAVSRKPPPKEGEPKQRTIDDVKKDLEAARKKREKLIREAPKIERAFAVTEAERIGNARVQIRGEKGRQGEEVPRHFLSVMGRQTLPPDEKGSGRLQLADWLASPQNPLTARVMANRIWQFHFGKGLVQSPSDFGIRGKPPTHPKLLDFLASQFVSGGWSIKKMHRTIMLSSTYQQSSQGNSKFAEIDARNDFIWKFDRRRMEAEAIRDSLLFLTGDLHPTPGAEHPFPPEFKWSYTQHAPFTAVYESNRRSVYLMQQRIRKHPYLELFDGADPNITTPVRTVNITPLQALFMMNNAFMEERAKNFANALLASKDNDRLKLDQAYERAFGRLPTKQERDRDEAYLKRYADRYQRLGGKGPGAEQAWVSLAKVILSSNEYIFID